MARQEGAGGARGVAGRHRRALVLALLALAVLLAALLGGVPRLLVTSGTSMVPTFRAGDLAVLLPSDDYAVGDVAAYRSTVLRGTTVLHRVVEVLPDGRLRLQGDSNGWVDPEQPVPDAMLGELLLRVPRGGVGLDLLRDPRVVLVGGTALVLLRRRRGRTALRLVRRASAGSPSQGRAADAALQAMRVRSDQLRGLLRGVRLPARAALPGAGRSASSPAQARSRRWVPAAAVLALLGVLALLLLPGDPPSPAVSTSRWRPRRPARRTCAG